MVEDGNIVQNDKNTGSVLNKFFSNIITNPGIPQYNEMKPVRYNIGDPLMKAIIKYRCHHIIIPRREDCNSGFSLSLSQVEHDEIMKETINLKI